MLKEEALENIQDAVELCLEVNEREIAVREVKFREDLYPRIETHARKVQEYAEDLSVLPPIEVNQHFELIDGWHRWTAHKKVGAEKIRIVVTETQSDIHLLELAIQRNASWGLQLSREDKRDMARKLYHMTPEREREGKKAYLAKLLSVGKSSVYDWLSRIDKDTKETRDKRIFDLWLSCHTQEEIAGEVDCTHKTVSNIIEDFGKNSESGKITKTALAAADHATDFEPPLYNIWKFKEKSIGSKHPGNTEATILDNLLYLYTKPFDVVIDPFAGGGSTIDICKKRLRRYWASDRKPIVEREKEIRKLDIAEALPSLPRWNEVRLVYLDPPYWKQVEGKYSQDPTDLANMSLDDFTGTLSGFIGKLAKKLPSEAYIALIIQPTQWNAPERKVCDHIADMLRLVKLPLEMRISAPYESQQMNAQMVNWAKANKKLLVLTREIIVWRVDN